MLRKFLFVFFVCITVNAYCDNTLFTVDSLPSTDVRLKAANKNFALADDREDVWVPFLKHKRVALLGNHTSLNSRKEHLLDRMLQNGIDVRGVFSPEHGFRGNADAGEKVSSDVDKQTGIPIWSLYGGGKTLTALQNSQIDVVVVDLQDVGLRFYTYYITMLRVMEACYNYNIDVLIMDRPNPNGMYVDGPVLDMTYRSGVGALPIPIVHGMTMGELALMAIGEGWTKAKVHVLSCLGYTHSTRWHIQVAPSPNLKSQHAVYLYPSTCLFEGTILSLGRGTDYPFECYGHPDMSSCDFSFTPRSVPGAKHPPLENMLCYGVDLRQKADEQIISEGFTLRYIIDAYEKMGRPENFFTPFFRKLVGNIYIEQQIVKGTSEEQIRKRYLPEVEKFLPIREKYLLYEE
ncbi:MAG: DUF1343 domain-containing protein [Alistipes sp.]|nr:DUF1343 domain-containing protein [Candidatus Alistipes equi]